MKKKKVHMKWGKVLCLFFLYQFNNFASCGCFTDSRKLGAAWRCALVALTCLIIVLFLPVDLL